MSINRQLEVPVRALLVGTFDLDGQVVRELFHRSGWHLLEAGDRRRAMQCLSRNEVHVVLTEAETPVWNWRKVLHDLQSLKRPPQLVVTSPHADDRLWAEALNLGAYDVLPQPFETHEVQRVIESARRHYDIRPTRMERFGDPLLSAGVA